jgi:hypothetical protein
MRSGGRERSATRRRRRRSPAPAPFSRHSPDGLRVRRLDADGSRRLALLATESPVGGLTSTPLRRDDGWHDAAAAPESGSLPFGLQRHLNEHLQGPVPDRRDAQGPRPADRPRDVHPPDRLRSVAPEAQASGQSRPALGRLAHHAVDAGRVPARVLLGHPADREPSCGCGADQELLQVLRLPSPPGRRDSVSPRAKPGGLR